MKSITMKGLTLALVLGAIGILALGGAACSGEPDPALKVGGIPDQDSALLVRRYQVFSEYLSDQLGVSVEYVPSVDYAAVVTAFSHGDLDLAFFGGLTGVQARIRDTGAVAIAQRERDAMFHSKFIVRAGLPVESLFDLKEQAGDLTLTFGSENSTSGHLMPRHFMVEEGIDPDGDFRSLPNFSGSHDLTWKLVEAGSFDVGALSEAVWQRAVDEARVDLEKVRAFYTTPDYFDYNFTAAGSVDEKFGSGFTERVQQALLSLNSEEHAEILDLFSAERFIETNNENYGDIEQVARTAGIIQ